MRRIIILAAAALALSAAPVASAHYGAPFWSAPRAELMLLDGIDWDDGRSTAIDDATCVGRGFHRGRLFRHFTCYIDGTDDDGYEVSGPVAFHTGWGGNFRVFDLGLG